MRLYTIAMESEAKDIIKNFEKIDDEFYDIYKNENVLIVITKIGKVNASTALTYLLSKFSKIKEVINIGFAGAYGDFTVGEEVLVNEFNYGDFDLTVFGYKKGEVPNLDHPIKTDLNYLRKFYDLKRCKLFTSDKFENNKLSENFLADMEATALSHVSHIFKKSFLSIKIVSDIINKNIEEYKEFEQIGSKNIAKLYEKIELRLN